MILWSIKQFGIQLMKASLEVAVAINLLEYGISEVVRMLREFMLIIMRFYHAISISMRILLQLLALMDQ
jgi:hypothetical protein